MISILRTQKTENQFHRIATNYNEKSIRCSMGQPALEISIHGYREFSSYSRRVARW